MRPHLPMLESDNYLEVLGAIKFGVQEKKMTIVLGDPGSGKTSMLKRYAADDPLVHYILCSPNMTMKDVLLAIAKALGIHVKGDSYQVQCQITAALENDPNHCLLFDECEYLHHGNVKKLDVLRQIFDATEEVPFVLCGTYKLRELLAGINDHSQPQIFRRLIKAEFSPVKADEVLSYLDLLEKEYTVRFLPDARTDLCALCLDSENGGLGIFISQVELLFSIVRPEWKGISLQRVSADPNPNTLPADTSALELVSIDKKTIRDACRYKMTK